MEQEVYLEPGGFQPSKTQGYGGTWHYCQCCRTTVPAHMSQLSLTWMQRSTFWMGSSVVDLGWQVSGGTYVSVGLPRLFRDCP